MIDREDFLRYFLKQEADLRAFIGALVFDPHRREDVFQEVALTLWSQFMAYDPTRPFGAWARGVAAKKILQERDKQARFPLVLAPETITAVLEAYERQESQMPRHAEVLQTCLQQLPERSRHLLTLRYEQGLKAEQMARLLRSTIEAIYQMLSRVRVRLEECIRRKLAMEEKGA